MPPRNPAAVSGAARSSAKTWRPSAREALMEVTADIVAEEVDVAVATGAVVATVADEVEVMDTAPVTRNKLPLPSNYLFFSTYQQTSISARIDMYDPSWPVDFGFIFLVVIFYPLRFSGGDLEFSDDMMIGENALNFDDASER